MTDRRRKIIMQRSTSKGDKANDPDRWFEELGTEDVVWETLREGLGCRR